MAGWRPKRSCASGPSSIRRDDVVAVLSILCRDCGEVAHAEQRPGRCAHCGSPRLVAHEELETLSIAHVDCDAFYASIEKRDDPSLRDRPLIIGGGTRGVVSTCCYIARQSGFRSAMPMFTARKLCPDAVIIPPNMAKYVAVSRQVRQLMDELTPLVEPLSIDEAFLDLSGTQALHKASPALVLSRFAKRVEDGLGITISVGLSHNKFLAKIASDLDKPRGFAVIGRAETLGFLAAQPVSLIYGVGKVFAETLNRDGFESIGQLQQTPPEDLMRRYGETGARLLGEDEYFVASDIPAILAYTRNVVFLADQEMAVVTREGAVFTDFAGAVIAKTPTRVTWDPIAAEKAGYKHFMLKEIFEQPAAVRDTILGRVSLETGTIFPDQTGLKDDVLASIERITLDRLRHLVACGPGRQVPDRGAGARAGRGRLRLGVPLPPAARRARRRWRSPSRSRARRPTRWRRCARRRQQGARSLAICNVVGSMATRESDGTIYTHAGPEIGVASTKAFTSQLVALYLLALHLAQARKTLDRRRTQAPYRRPAAAAAADRAGAQVRAADRGDRRLASTPAPTSSTSDAASTTRLPSKAR